MALDAVEENGGDGNGTLATPRKQKHSKHRQWCKAVTIALALLLILLVLLGVVLALTVFKIKEPRTQITSVSLEGIAPRVSIFPAINIQLNVTLNLTLNIQNPNHASFKSALGQGVLLYRGDQVGDAQLNPGLIPAMGNATLFCLLTVQVDRLIQPGLTSLFSDIMAGQLAVETKTRIPGKVSFLGILRKHIVSTSDCQIVIGFPDLSIRSQDCQQHTKL